MKIPITFASVRAANLLVASPTNAQLSMIRALVAKAFNVHPADLSQSSRMERLAWPRMVCMYLACRWAKIPQREVAIYWHFDHSNVHYAVAQVNDRASVDSKTQNQLSLLVDQLKALL